MSNRVLVTGIGIVSAYGVGHETYWEGIRSGQSLVRRWSPLGVEDFPVKYAASIETDIEILKRDYQSLFCSGAHLERRAVFGLIAAQEALSDAQKQQSNDEVIGVSVCSGVPDADDHAFRQVGSMEPKDALIRLLKEREHLISDCNGLRAGNDMLSRQIAEQFDLSGPVMNVNGACAGATQAIGMAYQAILRGEADSMLAGGGDSVLNIRTLSALYLLGATSTTSRWGDALCRPFDAERSGLVAGEGACVLHLESEESALKRGAQIYGEIVGYGSSLDAYKVTAPHPEGVGAITSMQRAIDAAGLVPEQIEYINAHGTSTPLNDVVETRAIKALFGQHSQEGLMVSSTKSMIGHWIAAAGAPEAAACLLALKHQCVPPTIHLESTDPDCDLDYVSGQARHTKLNYCLSNSFGFGGLNATLAMGRYPHE
jgi:3-oxoacyl-[acyl-carrier-protein] synthase II